MEDMIPYDRVKELLEELSELGYLSESPEYLPEMDGPLSPLFNKAEVRYSNWEYHPNREDNRNYRSIDNPDFDVVLEHATRRGEYLEATVTFTFDMGSVHDYPQYKIQHAKDKVIGKLKRLERAAELEAEAKRLREEG